MAVVAARTALRFPSIERLEKQFIQVSHHRSACIVWSGVLAVLIRVALLPVFPVPTPGVHDEYSYLLGADTFAHASLSNPTHPIWIFFESFHILQHPRYMSMYPVAQSIFLTVGQLIGSPWVGVLLSMGLLCSATQWMLLGWLAPQWALLGTCLAAERFAIASYWVDSYWGGAGAALGGVLVLGALPRLVKQPTIEASLLCGLGLLLLANSRPYEGLFYATPLLVWFSYRLLFSTRRFRATQSAKAALPGLFVLAGGAFCMLWYFKQSTGDPTLMPYMLHSQQYEPTRPFLWDALQPTPTYNHSVMQAYYGRQTAYFQQAHHLGGWLQETVHKGTSMLMFYLWPGILLSLFMLPRSLATLEGRIALASMLAVWFGISLEIWPMALHYPAPMMGATVLLLACSIRESRRFRVNNLPTGIQLSRVVPVLCSLFLLFRIGAQAAHLDVPQYGLVPFFTILPGNLERQRIIKQLDVRPEKALVIVHYEPSHDVSQEWVYNSARIDQAKVVWAREMNPRKMKQLIDYFPDRKAWMINPDKEPVTLVPYGSTTHQLSQ